jgi:hypothetical protein
MSRIEERESFEETPARRSGAHVVIPAGSIPRQRSVTHNTRCRRLAEDASAGGQMNAAATIAPAPQHLRALARANEVRLARAELKRQVAEGEVTAAHIILECPWEAASMSVSDLLTSQRRWGSTRCRKVLASIPMSENKTVGSMTERQRTALAGLLQGIPA